MPTVFRLEIEMENAAFVDDPAPHEVARILDKLANRLNRRVDFYIGEGGVLLDLNGNTVGKWTVTTQPVPPLEGFGQGDPIEKI